jgi:hypothetical protein
MNDLIQQLVAQLGVQESQAKGGAGLLFKLAQDSLGGDFSKIASALPGVSELIGSVPDSGGGLAGLAGGLLGKLGGEHAKGLADLAGLAGGFSELKLDSSMIAQFIPVIISFAKSQGGGEIADLLAKALSK